MNGLGNPVRRDALRFQLCPDSLPEAVDIGGDIAAGDIFLQQFPDDLAGGFSLSPREAGDFIFKFRFNPDDHLGGHNSPPAIESY